MKVMSIIAAVAGAIFRVVLAVAIVYLIYRGTGICYDYGYRVFTEPAVSTGEGWMVTVTVDSDMSALAIGKLFESKGLVRDARLFAVQYYLSEYRKAVEPGTFELSTAMTAEEMMEAMANLEDEEAGKKTPAPGAGSALKNSASMQEESGINDMPPAGGADSEEGSSEDSR